MKAFYYWNYERVFVEHIWVKVQQSKELRWFNFECDIEGDVNGYSFFPALRFDYLGDVKIISNDCGSGIHALRTNNMKIAKEFLSQDIKKIYSKGDDHYLGKVLKFNERCWLETEAGRKKYFLEC